MIEVMNCRTFLLTRSIATYLLTSIVILSCTVKEADTNPSTDYLSVKGRFLMTPCEEKVILRGINEMFIWSEDRTGTKTLAEIAKTGANTVRLVWTTKGSPAELDQLITNCINLQMIPIPELHDATGKIERVPELVDYWTSEAVVSVLKKHEAYLIINVANEPGLDSTPDSVFNQTYQSAIYRMRKTGIKAPLMIDATNWGQDIDMLQRNWQTIMNNDPLQNVLFSVHTWWPKDENSSDPGATLKVISELEESVTLGIPLVVAEFAPMGPGCTQYFDYETLIKTCHEKEIGWLSWSWGLLDNSDCADMDITDGGIYGHWTQTTANGQWGEAVCVSSAYSIQKTSVKPKYISLEIKCN